MTATLALGLGLLLGAAGGALVVALALKRKASGNQGRFSEIRSPLGGDHHQALRLTGESLKGITEDFTDERAFQVICDYGQEISGSLFVAVALYNRGGDSYEIRAVSRTGADTVHNHLPLTPGGFRAIAPESGFARQLGSTDTHTFSSLADFFPALSDDALRAGERIHQVISFPVAINGAIHGAVVLFRDVPTAFPDMYEILAVQCALVLKFSSQIREINQKRALEEMLHHSQKLDAIGQLAGGIAHDFNNMLSGIAGYAHIIKRTFGADNRKLAEYIEMIITASARAADLVTKLLAFAREGKYQIIAVDVHQVIDEVIHLLERTIDKRITIIRTFKATVSTIAGDPAQVQNALLNLGVNARDAMPDGGELHFETATIRLAAGDQRLISFGIGEGEYLAVIVRDTGVGMDEKALARVFEPFFTTKEVGKGSGLGLASVYGSVKSHGGHIEVSSEPGKGASFCIYLPLLSKLSAESEAASLPIQSASGTGSILVVDDEQIVRDLYHTLLTEHGFRVKICRDGREALDWYRKHAGDIDLIILDMVMPHINGIDCFKAMREINPEAKALIATGFDFSKRTQTIMTRGVRGFLQKPFDEKALLGLVNEILDENAEKQPR